MVKMVIIEFGLLGSTNIIDEFGTSFDGWAAFREIN